MGIDDTQRLRVDQTSELPRTVALKQTRRVLIAIAGSALIVAGLVLIILPGPFTIPLILLGLTILSWEFRWAKRLLFKTKSRIRQLRAQRRHAKSSRNA